MGRPVALGALLLAVFYAVSNGVPLAQGASAVGASAWVHFFAVLLLPPVVWAWFFATLSPQAALTTLIAAVVPQALYSWREVWPTFSFESIDSILYLFSGVFLPVAYALFLFAAWRGKPVATRPVAYVLWVLTTFQAMAALISLVMVLNSARGSFGAFFSDAPWQTFWRLLAGDPQF